MALFDAGGLVLVGLVLFWLWAIYDVATTEPSRVRNLPKVMWLLVVVLLSPIALDLGPILWTAEQHPEDRAEVERDR